MIPQWMTGRSPVLAWMAALVLSVATPAAAQVPPPDAHFGFRMGADRQLADADAIEKYFELVASRSDRVRLIDIGPTTEGRRTLAAIVTAPENLARLDEIQATNRKLADPRTLSPEEARRLAATQTAVLAIGCSIHASEIGATQAANELLFQLATATDPAALDRLRNVVVILIPMLNPDGHRLVVDWYERQKGTPFEGGAMPWLYQKYAGHDINRDAFMMNLAENRNLARFFYSEWHPQVFLTMHQMASNGPRFFVPPTTDPIDPNYDPLIWRTAALLGGAMGFELQRDGRRGVMSDGMYDYYWPGYEDSAPLGHNTVCLLTEVASVRVATPITISSSDLRAGQKGLAEYRAQINFPDPWPGGPWTLRDIVDYDLSAVNGLLRAVAAYREPIVRNFYEMGRRAIEAGRIGGPFAFVVPPEQHDLHAAAKLRDLLLGGHIEIHRALEPFRADGEPYPAGTDIIFLAQPFRAYVKTLLERQRYPARRLPRGGVVERPYDVTGWTLPLQMGVDVRTIERTFEPPAMSRVTTAAIRAAPVRGERKPGHYLIDARGSGGALAAGRLAAAGLAPSWLTSAIDVDGFHYQPGSLVVPHSKSAGAIVAQIARDLGTRIDGVKGKPPRGATPIARARVALYRPWTDNIDEGWTRWLLETYGFAFTTVTDADMRAGQLGSRFDAIILPSAPAERLMSGNPPGTMPSEYVGGLDENGVAALRSFVDQGGTLICLDQAAGLALRVFDLPLRDIARDAGDRFFCPGSIVRLELDPTHPLTYGMSPQTAGFFSFSAAYGPAAGSTSNDAVSANASRFTSEIDVVARYGRRDVLLSGYLEGEYVIADQPAVVEAHVGSGRVVLFGFPPQHRGQTLATFRLLFNAILTTPRGR
jgi:hypothetical protein